MAGQSNQSGKGDALERRGVSREQRIALSQIPLTYVYVVRDAIGVRMKYEAVKWIVMTLFSEGY